MVAQQGGHTGQRGAFHLEVGDAQFLFPHLETETLDVLQHIGHGQRNADHAALGAIKAGGRYGDALQGDIFHQPDNLVRRLHEIGRRKGGLPIHMLFEGRLHRGDGDLLAVFVPVHHPVEAYADVGEEVTPQRNIGMERTGSADSENVQAAVDGFNLAGFEVDVGQGVQFRHHDVDIVRAYTVGQRGDALSIVFSGDGNKLARSVAAFDVGKIVGQHIHAAGISHHYDIVGQLFGLQMNMESGAVSVNNEL